MQTGAVSLSQSESLINSLSIQVLTSNRQTLGSWWRLNIVSPFWRLYVNNRPGAQITIDSISCPLSPASVYLIPAWIPFQTEISRPVRQDYIHFNIPAFAPALHRQRFTGLITLPLCDLLRQLIGNWQRGFEASAAIHDNQPPLTPRFTDAHRSITQPLPLKGAPEWTHFAHASALTYAAMAMAVESLPADRRDANWHYHASDLRPAFERIEHNLRTPPDNAELAALCNCSTDHFIRRFSEITEGIPPHQYGLQLRLAAAAQLLAQSLQSIDTIAEQTGFTDRFHLSRHFSRNFGLPPAAYRHLHNAAT